MKLSAAEVYEVATFYHHFDVVKDGGPPPKTITVRCAQEGGAAKATRSAARAHAPCRRDRMRNFTSESDAAATRTLILAGTVKVK